MWSIRRAIVAFGLAAPFAIGQPLVSSQQSTTQPPGFLAQGLAAGGQVDPQIYVDDGGRVYRLWVETPDGQGGAIRLLRSTDGGQTWPQEAVTLDRDKPAGTRSGSPAFALDGSGRAMAIWRTKYRAQQARKEMQFLASTDRGDTWVGRPQVLNQGGGALEGAISADGEGHVGVVWYDERRRPRGVGTRSAAGFQIFFNRSEDFGRTWLPDGITLSGEVPGVNAGASAGARRVTAGVISALPRIQSDSRGRVYVAWVDNREGRTEIYFRGSTDHGQTWGAETNLSRGALSATDHQLLTDGEGNVFLVWADRRHGSDDVFFARSEDGGRQWTEPTRLSRRRVGATVSALPRMALDPDGRVYVAWQDRRNGRDDIYLNVSPDQGRTWLHQDIRIDRDDAGTGISMMPDVVARKGGNVAVAWSDDRTGFDQILLNWSKDGGATWLDQEIRVDTRTAPEARAKSPRLAWDATGAIHAVWEVWKGQLQSTEKRVEYRRLDLTPVKG